MSPGDFDRILQHRFVHPPSDPADVLCVAQEALEGKDIEEHGKVWDHAWKEKRTAWDRGGPSIALHETLNEYPELFNGNHPDLKQLKDFVGHSFGYEAASGTTRPSTKKKKALVPACGRGYDAVLLAYVFGYDVYGLDISPEALVQAHGYLRDIQDAFMGLSSGPEDFPFWVSNRTGEPGEVKYVLGDFFSDQWMKEEGIEDLKFDLIFDYTVSSPEAQFGTMPSKLTRTSSSAPSHPLHGQSGQHGCSSSSPAPAEGLCASNSRRVGI